MSHVIAGPVTFGSTILLPPQCFDWDVRKRQAVLAHEGAHVANRDFYLLLLASLNRSVFWFSPFAWWHLTRLAELAEIISDAPGARSGRRTGCLTPRFCSISCSTFGRRRRRSKWRGRARYAARVERILAATTAPAKLDWRKRIGTAAAILPVVVVSAGSITYRRARVSPSQLTVRAMPATAVRKPQSRLLLFIGSRIDLHRLPGRRRFLRPGRAGSGKLRLAAAGDGTYSYPAPAGQITRGRRR